MSTERLLPMVPPAAGPRPVDRVEYVGFESVGEQRVFRLRVHQRDGATTEFRFGIANSGFGAGRLSLQDGPDVCYQKLLRTMAAGEMANTEVITIDEAELASYREARKPVAKHRSRPPMTPSTTPAAPRVAREYTRPPFTPRRTPPPPVAKEPEAGLREGQRVGHAIFGTGVTVASSVGHTTVCFDKGGTKTFIASMLQVDVLSGPNTWETGPRGINRLRRTPPPPAPVAAEAAAEPPPPATEE
jgi:hypothetical protein